MTVVLSGPESSFPEGTELSISVSEPAKEAEELIEEAVQKQAEEQQMAVRDYTALDIRLLSDGEEIQPLGPVQVFSRNRKRRRRYRAKSRSRRRSSMWMSRPATPRT